MYIVLYLCSKRADAQVRNCRSGKANSSAKRVMYLTSHVVYTIIVRSMCISILDRISRGMMINISVVIQYLKIGSNKRKIRSQVGKAKFTRHMHAHCTYIHIYKVLTACNPLVCEKDVCTSVLTCFRLKIRGI